MYTNPTYQEIKQLQQKDNAYDDALKKSRELRAKRDALIRKRDSMNQDNLKRLEHLLPDNVDNIRLVIDLNNVAARHNLSLNNIDLGNIGGKVERAPGDTTPVGQVTLSFSVSTNSYDTFRAFIQDLEHSLRVLDIVSLGFSTGNSANSAVDYQMTIRTYWLH